MKAEFIAAAERFAAEEGCTVEIEQIWRIEPIPFDPGLIEIARAAVREVTGTDRRAAVRPAPRRRRGGPHRRADRDGLLLLDNGISHAKEEDTPIEHLELALRAYGLAAERVIRGAG